MSSFVTNGLVGWLFWVKWPFETVVQSMLGRLSERGRKKKNDRREKKMSTQTVQYRKILIGTFYRPPNSPSDILLEIENSIGLVYDTNIKEILVTETSIWFF